MTLPSDSSYPIADFRQLLSDRADLDLSPIELAEILWLALQKGEVLTTPHSCAPCVAKARGFSRANALDYTEDEA